MNPSTALFLYCENNVFPAAGTVQITWQNAGDSRRLIRISNKTFLDRITE